VSHGAMLINGGLKQVLAWRLEPKTNLHLLGVATENRTSRMVLEFNRRSGV
jgi:hypothetical protein